ncbi:ABC transporter permease [Vallitalea okinawensis]|uniref:ABC transporter permease n=1 Tax=Vallitalea okinawensis TaxID=2078660 RepID=UPI000CFBDB4A|nr:ABC transporter permease [Vallitalea okinawensis]
MKTVESNKSFLHNLLDKERRAQRKEEKKIRKQEKYYMASQWQLMFRKLIKHKLAVISFILLGILYFGAIFAEFLAPQGLEDYSATYSDAPPTKVHFVHEGEWIGPFVYAFKYEYDEYEMKIFKEDETKPHKIEFFVEGSSYKILGLFESNTHLFGVDNSNLEEGEDPVSLMLFGADQLGRDLFSRILIGSQVSLTVPLVGTIISFVLALVIGGISGYYGGIVDTIIQRIIEVLTSFPTLPLWMALSAAIPAGISIPQVYLYITIIMSLLSWPKLARVVRSKFLSLKNEDYITAARLIGVSDFMIIVKHLIPGFMSYLIVSLTLGIPAMILGETSMSFLGLGMRAPATSWGVLLQECQSIPNIANHPWKLIPVIFVIVTVLAFNFLGDGLRDAADPYK